MQNVRFSKWLVLSCLGLLISMCSSTSSATEFTADMTVTIHHDNAVQTSKIFVKESRYRMEQVEDGQEIVVLVDQEQRLTRVLLPADKMYVEIASDDMQSLMNDPFQAAKYTETIGEKTKAGVEKISGYDCDVYAIKRDGDDLMKLWVAKKLNFPMKIEIPGKGGRTMLLEKIKTGSLEDNLFAMPAGYTKMDEPGEREIELPEWTERIASAKYVEPPFEQMMLDEEILRVKIESGKGVKVSGTNKITDRSAFMAVPFKDGKPINEPTMYLYNLSNEGQTWSNTFKLTPYEADEIVIRVEEGTITLKLEAIDVGKQESVSAGNELKVPVKAGYNIDFRLVNIIDGESVCTVTLTKGGNEVSEDVIGPKDYRTYTLKKKGESKKNTWSNSSGADEFIVRVEKGEILVNVSQ
ncbi:hypothetical protein AMJ83_07220 [candidate division WOR_3 bacterium SM23_42]|uniref:DUF4412 domain-containing protein n=1 Tax=candidate division WOR_3 bacterium SM23_42 TaxID=1703779 RepID=A0A0S8FTG5_UNCW3|nr:MAG: hypothetical protein AMJ83_07220 [candidate division WOR_3 bacterium SM23_42]